MDLRGRTLGAGGKNVKNSSGLVQAIMMIPLGSQTGVVLTPGPLGQTLNTSPSPGS